MYSSLERNVKHMKNFPISMLYILTIFETTDQSFDSFFHRDNLDTDIYGANAYNSYLSDFRGIESSSIANSADITGNDSSLSSSSVPSFVRQVESILVKTGVSAVEKGSEQKGVSYHHRDIKYDPVLSVPSYHVDDVLAAVELIFRKESIPIVL